MCALYPVALLFRIARLKVDLSQGHRLVIDTCRASLVREPMFVYITPPHCSGLMVASSGLALCKHVISEFM